MKTATHGLTCCALAQKGDRFCIGTACGDCNLCYYVESVQMYVSNKSPEKFSSLVTCCTFSDDSLVYAAGGADGVVRVYSGLIEGEQDVESPAFGLVKKEHATQIIHTVQLVNGARLLDMKFNKERNVLYVAGSNSVIYSITFSAGQQPVVKQLALKCLPVTHIVVNNN